MAQGNDNRNDVVCSQSLTEETTITHSQRLVAGTLTYPPPELPTLPFDLLPEILCRLPVKLLIQLRCLCKLFNSLISDPKFAKKHLQLSTKRHHLMLTNQVDELALYDFPVPSLFSTSTVVTQTQLYIPATLTNEYGLCSCDGIFCGMLKHGSYFLWNPSIRIFKLLPPLKDALFNISFGYDHFIDNYKVIALSWNNEICVNTLGTDYWTIIDIPYDYSIYGSGIFVSGAVNWYAKDGSDSLYFILSLELENGSYRKLYLPDFENESNSWTLDVLRDCLCIFETSDMFLNVWIMKEYGNQESWTKLYTVPNLQDQDLEVNRALYISDDDQLLVEFNDLESGHDKLVVYNSKTAAFNILEFQNPTILMNPKVYIESLISP